jgi:hypothetical protein
LFHRSGLTPAAALLQHARGKTVEQLADASTNPSKQVFYHQFEQFNTAVNGDMGGDKMWDLVAAMEQLKPGVRVAFQRPSAVDGKDMGIAIVTPLMNRCHASIPQAAEILFVDTTSHVDLQNTSVTLLLTWSQTGAVPLGVLLTDCQTERAYKQGEAHCI